jgi:hypothetical protein
MGAGQFIPNNAASWMVKNCSAPASNTQFCFDLVNFMVRFTHSSLLFGRPPPCL